VYESRKEPPLTTRQFARRMLLHGAAAAAILATSLTLGTAGYHYTESMPWLDSVLEASLILSGMGPLHAHFATDAGKVFATLYALFSGVVFLGLTAILIAPIIHRLLHRFHLDEDGDGKPS
jgi:hypothetical protein